MRLAFVGKGGSGKSLIAGTLARTLAARGRSVLAVDSDPMPGLAYSIGVDAGDAGLPGDLVEESDEGAERHHRFRAGIDAAEVVERFAVIGPDGLRFLQMSKLGGRAGAVADSQQAFRLVLEQLPEEGWDVVGDLPGGTRQPFFRWARYARLVVVVVEPRPASLLSARRLGRLGPEEGAHEMVAVVSKARDRSDAEHVEQATGLPVMAVVPWDDDVRIAERRGEVPFDAAGGSPAVAAVASLADRLLEEVVRA